MTTVQAFRVGDFARIARGGYRTDIGRIIAVTRHDEATLRYDDGEIITIFMVHLKKDIAAGNKNRMAAAQKILTNGRNPDRSRRH